MMSNTSLSSLASREPKTNFDDTLGALLVGGMLAMALWGVTCAQVISFFRKNTTDGFGFKMTIAVLWTLDTIDSAFVIHVLYTYLVSNYNNPGFLVHTTWSLSLHAIETCINNSTIRSMFIWRYYKLSRNRIYTIFMMALSTVEFILSMVLILMVLCALNFAEVDKIRPLYYAANVGNVSSDLSIFIGLAILFQNSRTGFTSTDSVLNNLILFCANTGLLVVIDVTFGLVVFGTLPNTWYYLASHLLLSKLFLNSYLALLNRREGFRARHEESVQLSDLSGSQGGAPRPRSLNVVKEDYRGDLSISVNANEKQKEVDFATNLSRHSSLYN